MTRVELLMVGAVVLVGGLLLRVWWVHRCQAVDRVPWRRLGIVLGALLALGVGAVLSLTLRAEADYHQTTWLLTLLVIAGVWTGLQLRAWRRDPPWDAEGAAVLFEDWARDRLAKEWPVLAVFMIAPTVNLCCWPEVLLRNEKLFLAGLGALVLWWIVDERTRPDGSRLRDPLGLATDALRQLWRYKALLAVFVVCWLMSAGVDWLRMSSLQPQLVAEISRLARDHDLSAEEALISLVGAVTSGEQYVPQVALAPLGLYTVNALALVLAVCFILLMRYPPSWLPAAVRERLRWPTNLLIAGSVVDLRLLAVAGSNVGALRGGSALIVAGGWAAVVSAAPLLALVWWVLLRIAQHRPWGLRQATRVTAYCWGSIAALLLVWAAPAAARATLWSVGAGMDYSLEPFWQAVRHPLSVALALAPWLIVDRRMHLWPALAESWRLATSRGSDVLALAIRFWLMMSVAEALSNTVAYSSVWAQLIVKPLLGSFVALSGVLIIAAAYVILQRGPRRTGPRPRPE